MASKQYKTTKRYVCPYCDNRFLRTDLIEHIETKHPEMIPEGYSSARLIYEIVNKKNYGTCMICKSKVYEWDDKLCRYKNLCNKPACREAVRKASINNMMRVYNKPHLLDDPIQQEKMLAKRKISGTYKFSTDGTAVPYTGQYEKKLLEFFDQVLNVDGKDIQSPGPVFEYEYNVKKHFWITDIYYIPANLVIEVKDGGDNPNNRPMKSYREKQIEKERMITDKGTFNYLRLTNNNFLQLFEILADIKYDIVEPDRGVKISINENTPVGTGAMGGVPPMNTNNIYIIPTMMNNAFDEDDDKLSITALFDDVAVCEHSNMLNTANIEELIDPKSLIYVYSGNNDTEKIKDTILNKLKSQEKVEPNFILGSILQHKVLDPDELYFSKEFKELPPIYIDDYVKSSCKVIKNYNKNIVPELVKDLDNGYFISKDTEGYFVHEKINDDGEIWYSSVHYKVIPDNRYLNNYIIPKLQVVRKQLELGGEEVDDD